jgi:hypothetical protein
VFPPPAATPLPNLTQVNAFVKGANGADWLMLRSILDF